MGMLQVLEPSLIRLLRMLVPIDAFAQIVKALGCDPSGLAISSFARRLCLLIDNREGTSKEIVRVSIVVLLVLSDHFTHLFFLQLPDVHLLIAVCRIRRMSSNAKFLIFTRADSLFHPMLVLMHKILRNCFLAAEQFLLEELISRVCFGLESPPSYHLLLLVVLS